MRRYILFLLALAGFLDAYSHEKTGRVIGQVTDQIGDPLIGVTVQLKGTKLGAVSKENGDFRLEGIPPGNYSLVFTYVGFEKSEVKAVNVDISSVVNVGRITLVESFLSLDEVVVTPGSYSIMEKVDTRSQLALSEEDIKNMAWAEDITRAVARLPGISSSDYSSKFAIRGGESDEVLIALDGMELYEPFHQRDYSGGLFSIIDIEAVRGVDLMTGGFSAEYGNRLSGVFGMRTKNASSNERHVQLGLSVMNAQLYANGRFAKNRGSYLVSARRGMLDLSLKAIGNQEYFPKYYDGLVKIDFRLNDKHQIAFHLLHSGDQAFIDNAPDGDEFDQYDTKYYNTYGWLTLNSFYSDKLFSRTLLYTGAINHDRTGGFDKYDTSDKGSFSVDDQREYSFFGLKQDWSWETFDKLHVKFGFEAKKLQAIYHYVNSIHELRVNNNEELYNFDRDLDISLHPTGEQIGSYLTTRFIILPKLIAETGLRFDYTSYTGDKNWSPRVGLLYAFSSSTSLRAGWGYYYQSQFINTLDVNNGNTNFNSAELAKHYVIGADHSFPRGINIRLEAYYKDLSNISPLWQNLRDHLENYPEVRNDNAHVVFNGITSKGIELFLRYDEGRKISWWFSYALAQAMDEIKDIEFDGLLSKRTGKVPRLNNQTHTIYADINYRPTSLWHFNSSWQFYKGWPRTDYTYRYTYLPNGDIHFYQVHAEFNGTLYPAYHRLDLRANRRFTLQKGSITAYLHLINAYNRQNLKKFDLDTRNDNDELSIDKNGNYVPFEDNKYWLGFLPVFGFRWEF
uniref:TonB-dependent receptor n=1 Tax=Roseihalotalea indica TaxID=2867963 RepID=A0AA49JCY7_9BACT|nr:TonB-dependent receptor [Tunicatimonas sp. TK19036]